MTTSDDAQHVLAEVFEFSADDLAANRSGQLTEVQRSRIADRQRSNVRLARVSLSLFFALGLFGLTVEMMRSDRVSAVGLVSYLGVGIVAAVAVELLASRSRRRTERALAAAVVTRSEGEIVLVSRRIERRPQQYLCVDDHCFTVERMHHFDQLQRSGVMGRRGVAFALEGRPEPLSIELVG